MRLRRLIANGALLGAFAAASLTAPRANGTLAIAASLPDLVQRAEAIVIVTPVEQHSYEYGGRIVTKTLMRLDAPIAVKQTAAKELHENSEIWVHTLGGRVRNIGQVVDGQPQFFLREKKLLFVCRGLYQGEEETFAPCAGGQGVMDFHATSETTLRGFFSGAKQTATSREITVRKNVSLSALLPKLKVTINGPAEDDMPAGNLLDGKSLGDAMQQIRTTWNKVNGAQ